MTTREGHEIREVEPSFGQHLALSLKRESRLLRGILGRLPVLIDAELPFDEQEATGLICG